MNILNQTNSDIISSFICEISPQLADILPDKEVTVISEDSDAALNLWDEDVRLQKPFARAEGRILYNQMVCDQYGLSKEEIFALLMHEIGHAANDTVKENDSTPQSNDFAADDFVCERYNESYLVDGLYKMMWNCDVADEKQRILDRIARINIRRWNIPMPQKDYTVVIQCSTYNQEKYIEETLQGFVMQKTNFPFCALLTDDGSTDRNVEIIQRYANKYPDIIIPILLGENHLQHKKPRNPYFEPWHKRGKYIAVCEGDDYWTDPYKLQKQVDFLDAHPDYSLCCHNWKVYNEGRWEDSPVHKRYTEPFSFTFATMPWVWITKSLTLLYRMADLDLTLKNRYKYSRDVHTVYHLLQSGKGYYSPEIMAVYRVCDSGIWSKHDVNEKNRTTYLLYKELYSFEPNKSVRKRYMNATLAYFNGLAFGKKTWWQLGTNAKLYFEALSNISDAKDIVFCLGGLVPTQIVQWVMKTFKV